MEKERLGRKYNSNNMCYEFSDGSGVPVPKEVVIKFDYWAFLSRNGIFGAGACALGVLFKWKDRYKKTNQSTTNWV